MSEVARRRPITIDIQPTYRITNIEFNISLGQILESLRSTLKTVESNIRSPYTKRASPPYT